MTQVVLSPHFRGEAKRLIKKYASLATELKILLADLAVNPTQGKPLGRDCYKIRLAIPSKGKSGGGRVITCVKVTAETVTL